MIYEVCSYVALEGIPAISPLIYCGWLQVLDYMR